MSDGNIQNLWGHAFRLVSDGLAERDVVAFVEKLMIQHRATLKQASHLSSLHELATNTVEQAQEIAATIKENAAREAEIRASEIIDDAGIRADEIIDRAKEEVKRQDRESDRLHRATLALEALRKAQLTRISEIDRHLQKLKASAKTELSTRMKSHYIGKHLAQSMLFVEAFEEFIRQIEAELSTDLLDETENKRM